LGGAVVCQKVVFDLLAADVGEHHSVDLDAGGEGWPDLRTISAYRSGLRNTSQSSNGSPYFQDRADAIAPAAVWLQIGLDVQTNNGRWMR
jgi:hypothetical protein